MARININEILINPKKVGTKILDKNDPKIKADIKATRKRQEKTLALKEVSREDLQQVVRW